MTRKINMTRFLTTVVFTASVSVGCSNSSPPEVSEQAAYPIVTQVAASDKAGAVLSTINVTFPNRSPTDVAGPSQRLARVLLGEDVKVVATGADSRASHCTRPACSNHSYAAIEGKPNLRVEHNPDADVLEAYNLEVMGNHDSSIPDLTPEAALKVFTATYASLTKEQLVSPKALALADVRTSDLKEAATRSDQTPVVRIAARHFFVPLKAGGVAVHDAEHHELGLTVIVHRSGKLSALRVWGLAACAGVGDTVGVLGQVARGPSKANIDALVASKFANADIESVGLRHVVERGTGSHKALLRQVYYVLPRMTINGQSSHGRGVWVSFPLDDVNGEPDMWPVFDPANPRNVGDPR